MTDTTDQKRPSEKLDPNYDNRVYDHLKQSIEDYLQWMKSVGYAPRTRQSHQAQLNQFLCFSKNTAINWEKLFTLNSLERFKKSSEKRAVSAICALSRYLFAQGKIPKPLAKKKSWLFCQKSMKIICPISNSTGRQPHIIYQIQKEYWWLLINT